MITGLELDSGKITAVSDGRNFTGRRRHLSLTDLPAGARYRLAFTDNASLQEAVSADLEVYGQTAAAASPALELSASTPAAGNDASASSSSPSRPAEDWTGL